MTDPKEFSCTDDSPVNTGWVGNEYEWDEIRPTNRQRHPDLDDPTEDYLYDDDYDEFGD